jgi:hypothetical protein
MLQSRGWLAQLLMLVGLVAAVAALLGLPSAAEASSGGVPLVGSIAAKRPPAPVSVRIGVAYKNDPLRVPRSFLGISTEYYTIPVLAAHLTPLKRVFSLLTQNGPVVLRIGGDSADVAVPPSFQAAPTWAVELTRSWLAQTSAIVKALHVKLILDLNTVTATPAAVATWVRVAEHSLPRGSIVGFEIGNEPDIYDPLTLSNMGVSGPLPPRLNATTYAAAFRTYDRALNRVIPAAPLLAPALSDPQAHISWIKTILAGAHGGLTAITAHRYPLSACAHFGPTVPTVARVLSETSTAGMAATLKPAIAAAARSHLPVRLTELNSVTCGGTLGVSDTFATALWAPDALLELIQAGVSSADLHVRTKAINTPFSFSNAGLVAYPLLYGLVTYARTLGSHPQILPAHVAVQPGVDLKTWVVLDGSHLRVLVIDKSGRAANAKLALPAIGPVTVQRLLARAATATTGVTLAGQTLDAQGQWKGAVVQQTVTRVGGAYAISVPRTSAAIVTATVRPGIT